MKATTHQGVTDSAGDLVEENARFAFGKNVHAVRAYTQDSGGSRSGEGTTRGDHGPSPLSRPIATDPAGPAAWTAAGGGTKGPPGERSLDVDGRGGGVRRPGMEPATTRCGIPVHQARLERKLK